MFKTVQIVGIVGFSILFSFFFFFSESINKYQWILNMTIYSDCVQFSDFLNKCIATVIFKSTFFLKKKKKEA